jgi:hypothetical protein
MLAEWADSREGQGRPLVPQGANSGMSNLGQWTDGRPTKARKEHHNTPGVLDGNATNSAKAETGEGREGGCTTHPVRPGPVGSGRARS